MKKIWFIVVVFLCGLLISWCFDRLHQNEDERVLLDSRKDNKIESKYSPIEERTKTLKAHPRIWEYKDWVYSEEWFKTIDKWMWEYPYSELSSKIFWNNLVSFSSSSEDWLIRRFSIYDRNHHKWLFDCFDWWDERYIGMDESINIIYGMSCLEKYEELMNLLNNIK